MSEVTPAIVHESCPAIMGAYTDKDVALLALVFDVFDCHAAADGETGDTEIITYFDDVVTDVPVLEPLTTIVANNSQPAVEAFRVADAIKHGNADAQLRLQQLICEGVVRCQGPRNNECPALGSTAIQAMVHNVAETL